MTDEQRKLTQRLMTDPALKTLPQIAYVLATVQHETAGTYRPITEYGPRVKRREGESEQAYEARRDAYVRQYFMDKYPPPKNGHTIPLDGYTYRGRGFVQITWKDNYERMGERLGVPLADKPELALDPDVSYRILVVGMTEGLFTGKKLGDFVTDKGPRNFVQARRVVNWLDKAELIAGHAEAHLEMLKTVTLPRGVGA